MRVLVVEDYGPIREAVVRSLAEEGYAVDECRNGLDAAAKASNHAYDVVVLDLNLPVMGGFDVLRDMRDKGVKSQVLILTGRSSVDDRVDGLDLGADDYLVKPFEIEEFLARVRALVRRAYRTPEPVISIGHVSINTNEKSVRVQGETVVLTAKEYALLEFLAFRKGQVVSRSDIWKHVYDEGSSAVSNVVDVYVGYLRKKLERKELPRVIHTRRGQGYLLSASA